MDQNERKRLEEMDFSALVIESVRYLRSVLTIEPFKPEYQTAKKDLDLVIQLMYEGRKGAYSHGEAWEKTSN